MLYEGNGVDAAYPEKQVASPVAAYATWSPALLSDCSDNGFVVTTNLLFWATMPDPSMASRAQHSKTVWHMRKEADTYRVDHHSSVGTPIPL